MHLCLQLEIKEILEKIYGMSVERVSTINYLGKKRMTVTRKVSVKHTSGTQPIHLHHLTAPCLHNSITDSHAWSLAHTWCIRCRGGGQGVCDAHTQLIWKDAHTQACSGLC